MAIFNKQSVADKSSQNESKKLGLVELQKRKLPATVDEMMAILEFSLQCC